MPMPRFIVSIYSVWVMVLGVGVVCGQDYPNKPIRIVTSPPGGSSDFTARIIALGISGPLGQPVVVENRPTSVIGEVVAKAPPDGYTLLVPGSSFLIGHLLRETPFDPLRDFSPISLIVSAPLLLVVHPSLPVKSVKELIGLAKAKPGALNYAANGTGSANHLAAELFKAMTGVNIVNIPYKGSGPATIGLISGETQMSLDIGPSLTPHIKSGKLRALAVTSPKPSALFPDLPTVAATVPGYDTAGPTTMFAPAGTPAAIISRLNREVVRLLNQADVKEQFFNAGSETVGSSPEELGNKAKSEIAKWNKVIKDAGIRAN